MAHKNRGLAPIVTIVKLVLVFTTIVVFISYHYIPKRSLKIYPGAGVWWGAYTDSYEEGNSKVEYLNKNQSAIHCIMGDAGAFNTCGYIGVFADVNTATYDQLLSDAGFAISVSPRITRDFSSFRGVELDVGYNGSADFIYITLQNHEPSAGMTDGVRQFRPQSVGVSTSELHNPVYISLDDFLVGEWWIQKFSLHRQNSGARFDRVRGIGVEVKNEPAHSEHFIKVKSITFIGEWVSKEKFYFFIIIILASLLLLEGTLRVYSLYVSYRTAKKHLEELNERNQNLQSAVYKDELTQLLNRRAIYDIVLDDIEQKKDSFIAILVIDIDYFKKVNDTYGHNFGDKVLVMVAQSLKSASRDDDNIARWGGEEFVIVTKESRPRNLHAYAEKLRKKISSAAIYIENQSEPINVTVSIGFTIASKDENFKIAFERADTALYHAKQSGRNCCKNKLE